MMLPPRTTLLAGLAIAAAVAAAGAVLWLRLSQPHAPALPADQDEAARLAETNGLVWRNGAALHLRLKSGQVLTLTDRVSCGDLPCPGDLATRYHYLGWNAEAAGYVLKVDPAPAAPVVLSFADEEPALVDLRHAASEAGPLPLPAPPPPVAETDPSLVAWLEDVASQRGQSEAPLIAVSAAKARREGAELSLVLQDGRQLTLSDDLACGQLPCPPQVSRAFDFAGESKDGRFLVVERHWNEATDGLLVDRRSGGVTALLGLPSFSPDGSRAVATVTDLEWSAPRRLEVWSLVGPVPELEFSLPAAEGDDTVYEADSWTDSNHLRLRRGPWGGEQRSPAMLVHDAAGWRLEAVDAGN